MNDYRSWARLIELSSAGNKAATLGFLPLFHFASWCLEKVQPAGQTCYPVTAVTLWIMSLSFFTSSLLFWWGQWLPAAIWNVFPNEQQTPWVSDQRRAKLHLNSGRDHGRRKEDGVRSQGDSRKGGADRQWQKSNFSHELKTNAECILNLLSFPIGLFFIKVTILITYLWQAVHV